VKDPPVSYTHRSGFKCVALTPAISDVEGWPAEDMCAAIAINEANQRVRPHRARSKIRAAPEAHLEHPAVAEPVAVAA
jgi:hypothetical protein